ncbi:MAG: twin-arginine translocase TatA/TatE family subunit [Rectinemataceae bacterium]
MTGGIGPMELILILVIALVIFGPKKLPEIGKVIGDAIRRLGKGARKGARKGAGKFDSETDSD